jgi:hypothetical protein
METLPIFEHCASGVGPVIGVASPRKIVLSTSRLTHVSGRSLRVVETEPVCAIRKRC